MSKFKIGDEVVIVKRLENEGGKIGTKFIIRDIQDSELYPDSKTNTGYIYHSMKACKLVSKNNTF